MNGNKNGTPTVWIDPDDAPELTDAFFEQADMYVGGQLVRRSRPRVDRPKRALNVRYDAEVIEAFKATGRGWQTRMNDALKDWLKTTRRRQLRSLRLVQPNRGQASWTHLPDPEQDPEALAREGRHAVHHARNNATYGSCFLLKNTFEGLRERIALPQAKQAPSAVSDSVPARARKGMDGRGWGGGKA